MKIILPLLGDSQRLAKAAITFRRVPRPSSSNLFETNSYPQFIKTLLEIWKEPDPFAALFSSSAACGAVGCSQGALPTETQYSTWMTHPASAHFLCVLAQEWNNTDLMPCSD